MVLMFSGVGYLARSAGFWLLSSSVPSAMDAPRSRNSQSKSGFLHEKMDAALKLQGSKKSKAATLVRWSGL